MKVLKRFLCSICLISLFINLSTNAYASTKDEVMPTGLLSGYQQFLFNPSSMPRSGEFSITVNGTYAIYAGMTIKTSFPQDDTGDSSNFTLKRPDGSDVTSKIYMSLNEEKKDITIFNIPPGIYKVSYYINSPNSGKVEVWIF